MEEKVDVIIVGAGPAGLTAAFVLAKAGLDVVVLERGEYPGAKNMMGGILFTTVLGRLIPGFWEEAPLERRVTSRRFSLLSPETELSFTFSTQKYNKPPYNNTFTALRAKFDKWFAAKVEEQGALVLSGAVVDDLIWEEGKCVGVKTRLSEGNLYGKCVILAEGVNGLLAEKAGLKKRPSSGKMAIGVKEVMEMPAEVIEDRFVLSGNEGASIEYFGDAVKGMFGSGFIYTNKESISIGVVASIKDVADNKIKSEELLEHFKNHPCIRKLIRGGESKEYSAHLLPEAGYEGLPELVKDGLMIVGDCAGFLNTSHFHEGTNLAMASGMMAAEAVIEAKKKDDFSKRVLSAYVDKLNNSFVIKDMKKFRKFPQVMKKNPQLLSEYPQVLGDLMVKYFSISETPKKEVEKEVFRKFKKEIGIMKFSRTVFGMVRGMGWI